MEYVYIGLVVWLITIAVGLPFWNKYTLWIEKNFVNRNGDNKNV